MGEPMRICQVVAMDEARLIGCAGGLPWWLPADMRRFRWLTDGRPVLMGRNTYESLQLRPLPWRYNIVLSRRPGFSAPGCVVSGSLEESLRLARSWLEAPEGPAWRRPGAALFVIGGAALYRDTLPLTERIYLTRVVGRCTGDTHFPELVDTEWRERRCGARPADSRHPHAISYSVLERRRIPETLPPARRPSACAGGHAE